MASLVFELPEVLLEAGEVDDDDGDDEEPEPEPEVEEGEPLAILAPGGRLAPFCNGDGGELADAPTPCRVPGF